MMEHVDRAIMQPLPCCSASNMTVGRETGNSNSRHSKQQDSAAWCMINCQICIKPMIGDRSCMHALPRLNAAVPNLLGWGCPSSSALRAPVCRRVFALCLRMLSPFSFKVTPPPRVALMRDLRGGNAAKAMMNNGCNADGFQACPDSS